MFNVQCIPGNPIKINMRAERTAWTSHICQVFAVHHAVLLVYFSVQWRRKQIIIGQADRRQNGGGGGGGGVIK